MQNLLHPLMATLLQLPLIWRPLLNSERQNHIYFFFSYWISFCTLKYVTLWKWNWLHVKFNIKFWPNVYCEVQTVEHGVSNTWYFINEAREEHGQITVSIQSAREKAYIYMPNSIMFCYSFLHPSTTPTPYYQLVPIPARDTRGVLWVWAKFWA